MGSEMADSINDPGTFVEHAGFGVGRVISRDDSGAVMVEFRSGEDRYMSARIAAGLKALPDDGLEAVLWTKPDETLAWATDAPLKLLAATLTDIGGSAKAGAIKEKLEGRVLDGVKWNVWWDKVRSAAGDSKYFTTVRNKSNSITELGLYRDVRVGDVPAGPGPEKPRASRKPKKKPPSVREWKRWLLSDTDEPAPGGWPNSKAFNDLYRWAPDDLERALTQATRGTREFLASGDAQAQGRAGWLNALSLVALRLRECTEAESGCELVMQLGELLPQLTDLPKRNDPKWTLPTTALTQQWDGWHRALATGIWSAFKDHPNDIRNLFGQLCSGLEIQNPVALAEEICLAALRPGESPRVGLALDALLDALPAHQRLRLLHSLIVRAAAGDGAKERVVDYITATRHAADSNARLGLLSLSALLIPDVRSPATAEASRRLADALESPDVDGGPAQALFRQVRERNEEFRARIAGEFEARQEVQRQAYEERLERGRREEEHLRQQIAAFRAQMASGREESRLEVRQDMLLAVGDLLQRAHREERVADERLADVIANIPTALRAGGAETLGTVGETVHFDPRLHHSTAGLARGALVRVSAPGVIVLGGTSGDRVILKATVTRHLGGNQ